MLGVLMQQKWCDLQPNKEHFEALCPEHLKPPQLQEALLIDPEPSRTERDLELIDEPRLQHFPSCWLLASWARRCGVRALGCCIH